MAGNRYYELIEDTFERVESALEALPDDVDIRSAEGVINVTFGNGIVFVLSRQPPPSSCGWRRQVVASTMCGMTRPQRGWTPSQAPPLSHFLLRNWRDTPAYPSRGIHDGISVCPLSLSHSRATPSHCRLS